MEIYKAGSHDVVLSSSHHSIKTVHVIAIGLRRLLRRFLGEDLSEIDLTAMNEVSHVVVRKNETVVTAMMETKHKKCGKGQSRVETIRPKTSYFMGGLQGNKSQRRRRNSKGSKTISPVRAPTSRKVKMTMIFFQFHAEHTLLYCCFHE